MIVRQVATEPALNQDFNRYDQVRKTHTYRLTEHESDAFAEDFDIATLCTVDA